MKTFYEVIYKWVAKNYGWSEADDPSWSIEALAEELNKHFPELAQQHKIESLRETIAYVAQEELGVELTDEVASEIAERYLDEKEDDEAYYRNEEEELKEYIQDYNR